MPLALTMLYLNQKITAFGRGRLQRDNAESPRVPCRIAFDQLRGPLPCAWEAVVAAVLLVTLACGGPGQTPSDSSAAAPSPTPAPTIPRDFVVFTDELDRFSVAYPSSWEKAISSWPDLAQALVEVLRSKGSDLPSSGDGTVFYAGLPTEVGTRDPNVNVGFDFLRQEVSSSDYATIAIGYLSETFEDFTVHAQTKVHIGDAEAVIVDTENVIPGTRARARTISLFATDGRLGWTVICNMGPGPVLTEKLRTCNVIVRSFRLVH